MANERANCGAKVNKLKWTTQLSTKYNIVFGKLRISSVIFQDTISYSLQPRDNRISDTILNVGENVRHASIESDTGLEQVSGRFWTQLQHFGTACPSSILGSGLPAYMLASRHEDALLSQPPSFSLNRVRTSGRSGTVGKSSLSGDLWLKSVEGTFFGSRNLEL
ncbi:hypothetical protein TWF506_002690 [Arthrobotrys conoides]|uniref:Uncharacterized protein n=1 Tax=Arthrobotrys conoides TaxID=74498 RepID=A0AAN8NPD6_9PEZI